MSEVRYPAWINLKTLLHFGRLDRTGTNALAYFLPPWLANKKKFFVCLVLSDGSGNVEKCIKFFLFRKKFEKRRFKWQFWQLVDSNDICDTSKDWKKSAARNFEKKCHLVSKWPDTLPLQKYVPLFYAYILKVKIQGLVLYNLKHGKLIACKWQAETNTLA